MLPGVRNGEKRGATSDADFIGNSEKVREFLPMTNWNPLLVSLIAPMLAKGFVRL